MCIHLLLSLFLSYFFGTRNDFLIILYRAAKNGEAYNQFVCRRFYLYILNCVPMDLYIIIYHPKEEHPFLLPFVSLIQAYDIISSPSATLFSIDSYYIVYYYYYCHFVSIHSRIYTQYIVDNNINSLIFIIIIPVSPIILSLLIFILSSLPHVLLVSCFVCKVSSSHHYHCYYRYSYYSFIVHL